MSEILRLFSSCLLFGKYPLYLPFLLSKGRVLSKAVLLAATLKMALGDGKFGSLADGEFVSLGVQEMGSS